MDTYDRIRVHQEGLPNERGSNVRVVTQKLRKQEILRLLLAGHTTREVAHVIRQSVHTVRNYIRNVEFQEELRQLSEPIWRRVDEELTLTKLSYAQRIDEMSDRALARIEELLDSDDERVQLRAASEVLDRNPQTSKHHKVENDTRVMVINPEQLQLAARAALEISDNPSPIVLEGIVPSE